MFASTMASAWGWPAVFARIDDGAGGRWATLTRATKFYFRLMLRQSSVYKCAQHFHQLKVETGAQYPVEVCLRPLRPYLCADLRVNARVDCVMWHFNWLHTALAPDFCKRFGYGESISFSLPGSEFPDLGLVLRQSASQSREGELSLDLLFDGKRIMSATFSVIGSLGRDVVAQGRSAVLVGGFQGVRGTEQEIRELGTQLEKLRPSTLLTCAIQGLCSGWGLQAPVAISSDSHVTAHYARRRKIQLDYDEVWQEAGATRLSERCWQLPSFPQVRPESEVISKRRAQHRRRSALKARVFELSRQSANAMMRPHSPVAG